MHIRPISLLPVIFFLVACATPTYEWATVELPPTDMGTAAAAEAKAAALPLPEGMNDDKLPPWLRKERTRLAGERASLAARLERRQAACWQRFAVNNCLKKLRRAHRNDLRDVRAQELALNEHERAYKARQLQRELEEKAARAKERDEKRAAELEGVLPGTEPDAQEKPATASQAEPQDAAQATPVTAPKVGVSATLDATAAKAQNTETAAEGEEAAKEENKEEAKDGQAIEAPQQNQDTPETPEIPQTDAPAETTESQ